MATEMLDRCVSLSIVGDTAKKGDVLLLGGATVPDRHHSRPRKTVFPYLQAQLGGEVAEPREARRGAHNTVVVREV